MGFSLCLFLLLFISIFFSICSAKIFSRFCCRLIFPSLKNNSHSYLLKSNNSNTEILGFKLCYKSTCKSETKIEHLCSLVQWLTYSSLGWAWMKIFKFCLFLWKHKQKIMILQKMPFPVGKDHSIRKLPNFLESLS